MMPAARKETAIGMKRSSLKAVAQRTFSTRTARISPRPVSRAGATTTQMAVLRTAVRVAGSRNISA
ncbi:hypothetical protein GCM10010244_53190 [Streptomyces coeruleorubidus]|nr:hypothetical protein GCM10010244_53190 [Streptomyces bellus]